MVRFDETSILKRLGPKAAKNPSGKASEHHGAIIATPNRVRINLSYIWRYLGLRPTDSGIEQRMYECGLDDEGHYTVGENPAKDFKAWIDVNFPTRLKQDSEASQARVERVFRQGFGNSRHGKWYDAMYAIGNALDRCNPWGHLLEPAPCDHRVSIRLWPKEGPARDAWAAEWDAWAEEHLRGKWFFDAQLEDVFFASQSLSEATAVKLRWG